MNKRNSSYDVARGISIICIILGHLGEPQIDRIVYTFMVPMFFLIAGLVFKDTATVNALVKKRLRTLIVPYITSSLGIIVFALAINQIRFRGSGAKEIVLYWMKAALYGAGVSPEKPEGIPAIGAVWFLLAMFWANLIMLVVKKLKVQYAIPVVILLLIASCKTARIYWMPFSIQPAGPGLLFMYAGYIVKKEDIASKISPAIKGTCLIISVCLWLSFICQFEEFSMARCHFAHWYDLVRSMAACVVVIWLSKSISNKAEVATKALSYIGKYSIIILCLHIIELNTIPWEVLLGKLGFNNETSLYIWILVICKMVFVIGGVPLVLKSNTLRRLFGIRELKQ